MNTKPYIAGQIAFLKQAAEKHEKRKKMPWKTKALIAGGVGLAGLAGAAALSHGNAGGDTSGISDAQDQKTHENVRKHTDDLSKA